MTGNKGVPVVASVVPAVYVVHATPTAHADGGPGHGHGALHRDNGGGKQRPAPPSVASKGSANGDVNTGLALDGLDDAGNRVLQAIGGVVRPILVVLVIYGVVPVRLSCPLRLSVHPLRSTLLYVLAVQCLVGLSCRAVFSTYGVLLSTEADTAEGVDMRILASLSAAHVSSHIILTVMWTELHKLRKHLKDLEAFLKRHSHMIGALRLQRLTRTLPWISVSFSFVGGPAMMFVWCYLILNGEARITHGPSHLFQIVFVTNFLILFAASCMCVRDLAANLAANLKWELSQGHVVTASRLEEYRLAWISLRGLTANLGSTPLTGICLMGYLMAMITLSAYLALVSYANGYVFIFVSSLTLFTMCQAALIVICDAAHRLADEMTYSFYEPLEARSWRGLPNDLLAEHQQFLHTISCNPAEVTFAGMVTLKRSTYISMMAAIATYLIVLFQLRQSDENVPAPPPNSTDARLADSMFREQ